MSGGFAEWQSRKSDSDTDSRQHRHNSPGPKPAQAPATPAQATWWYHPVLCGHIELKA